MNNTFEFEEEKQQGGDYHFIWSSQASRFYLREWRHKKFTLDYLT
jgi:hypothetical protein